MQKLSDLLADATRDLGHPQKDALLNIICGPTEVSSSGFPFIAEAAFASFLAAVPHLFQEGAVLLDWLKAVEKRLSLHQSAGMDQIESVLRGGKVLQTIVQTAAITAPPDLWILRQVLSTHRLLGISSKLLSGATVTVAEAAEEFGFQESYLGHDFRLLYSRGLLACQNGRYSAPATSYLRAVLTDLPALGVKERETDWYSVFVRWLSDRATSEEVDSLGLFLQFNSPPSRSYGWWPSGRDVEIGFRVVPLVLAMHFTGLTAEIKEGSQLEKILGSRFALLRHLFESAGYWREATGVTALGSRALQKGPGPFGIIHAYRSYLVHHQDILTGKSASTWVARGENVAASQEANRSTFQLANSALDRFVQRYGFTYQVFIEHAVGQGEATRQRFVQDGEERIHYFGADLEDAAIDRAQLAKDAKILPSNMRFVRAADIGKPALLIDAVRAAGFATEGAVMVVGNGFHEVRNQTNEKMVGVFRDYCQAGIVLLFTEESGLMNEDLLATGWNTYHAGFRYVHDISGQGLRPALDRDDGRNYSWRKCAELGGYCVLQEFTTRTRTIYPHPRQDGYNPSISVNYFCVPQSICRALGVITE